MSTISETTFTFTVLHRTDEPFTWHESSGDGPLDNNLGEALARSWDGHAVGLITEEFTREVPDDTVEAELIELHNDGTFFDDDIASDGPDYSEVPEPQFPQTPEEARTCKHGNRVWFGHECGECEESEVFQWNDDRECRMVSIGTEAEVGEWFYCTTHNYEVLGNFYVCEGHTPPPYDPHGGEKHRYYEEN